MTTLEMWRECVHASGLSDLACEIHRHDLLDGIDGGYPDAPLDETFWRLCASLGVTGWDGVETVLELMRTVPGFDGLRLPDEALASQADRLEAAESGKVLGVCTNTSAARGTYQSTWGTPEDLLLRVRDAFGRIDVDLASSEEHNARVRAGRIYTIHNPCPRRVPVLPGEVVWCNPPGPGSQVKEFWAIWNDCLAAGAAGAFLFFQIDHWRQVAPPAMPLAVVILRRRLRYVGAKSSANFASVLAIANSRLDLRDLGHVVRWAP